jgi:hypothetical protein
MQLAKLCQPLQQRTPRVSPIASEQTKGGRDMNNNLPVLIAELLVLLPAIRWRFKISVQNRIQSFFVANIAFV